MEVRFPVCPVPVQVQVPDTVLAVFLAAAARACDDPASAERLEKAVDTKYLRRENGFYCLDIKREWLIGATAMRILALAEKNGSRFREWSDQASNPVRRLTEGVSDAAGPKPVE